MIAWNMIAFGTSKSNYKALVFTVNNYILKYLEFKSLWDIYHTWIIKQYLYQYQYWRSRLQHTRVQRLLTLWCLFVYGVFFPVFASVCVFDITLQRHKVDDMELSMANKKISAWLLRVDLHRDMASPSDPWRCSTASQPHATSSRPQQWLG